MVDFELFFFYFLKIKKNNVRIKKNKQAYSVNLIKIYPTSTNIYVTHVYGQNSMTSIDKPQPLKTIQRDF